MTYQLHVFYEDDHYEITVRGTTIIRVVKFVGESEFRREVEFDRLSDPIQVLILQEITEREFDDE